MAVGKELQRHIQQRPQCPAAPLTGERHVQIRRGDGQGRVVFFQGAGQHFCNYRPQGGAR